MSDATRTGERTYVRPFEPGDCDAWTSLRRESWSFLERWEPLPPEGEDPCGPEAFQATLQASRLPNHEKLLLLRRSDDALLGYVGINEIVRGPFQSAYLGYWVGAPHAGRGYMTEGVGLAIAHAFETLGLHRVEANVIPRNAPSLALVRRLGFRKEGLSRRYLRIAGTWEDHERWALLVEDWRSG